MITKLNTPDTIEAAAGFLVEYEAYFDAYQFCKDLFLEYIESDVSVLDLIGEPIYFFEVDHNDICVLSVTFGCDYDDLFFSDEIYYMYLYRNVKMEVVYWSDVLLEFVLANPSVDFTTFGRISEREFNRQFEQSICLGSGVPVLVVSGGD